MRALAEFIMRGRTQAATVALIGHWLPLIGPAAVALVTLRRGMADGLLVLIWALLPAIVFVVAGQISASLAIIGTLSVFAMALVLRTSVSWSHAVMGLVALNTLGSLLLGQLAPDFVNELVAKGGELIEAMRAGSEQPQAMPAADAAFVMGWLAAVGTISCALSLLLARWWQALLYNPGGFEAEFKSLRLKPIAASVCLLASLYCYWQPGGLSWWALVFALPLLFSGAALVHGLTPKHRLSVVWLALFYMALIASQPFKILLILVAYGDTWLDFRGRSRKQSS